MLLRIYIYTYFIFINIYFINTLYFKNTYYSIIIFISIVLLIYKYYLYFYAYIKLYHLCILYFMLFKKKGLGNVAKWPKYLAKTNCSHTLFSFLFSPDGFLFILRLLSFLLFVCLFLISFFLFFSRFLLYFFFS